MPALSGLQFAVGLATTTQAALGHTDAPSRIPMSMLEFYSAKCCEVVGSNSGAFRATPNTLTDECTF